MRNVLNKIFSKEFTEKKTLNELKKHLLPYEIKYFVEKIAKWQKLRKINMHSMDNK